MSEPTIEEIMTQVNNRTTSVSALLTAYRSRIRTESEQNLQLCRAFVKRLINEDEVLTALDLLVNDCLKLHPHDLRLRYYEALAHHRARSFSNAQKAVDKLVTEVEANLKVEAEVLCLKGRLVKDQLHLETRPDERRQLAQQAYAYYERARRLDETEFATINAATLARVAGDIPQSDELARAAIRLVKHTQSLQTGGEDAYWLHATLGEAQLLLGEMPEAADSYRRAVQLAGHSLGNIVSMRGNVALLVGQVVGVEESLPLFNTGPVVIFSGHMVDMPNRPKPRFPDDERYVAAVRQAIAAKLEELHPVIGYCQGACGADLIFAEEMLQRDAEVHLVLPFDKDDFYTTSVDFGFDARSEWRQRFDTVYSRSTHHFATEELYLGDDTLFAFANEFKSGLAITHARRLGVDPVALVVLDANSQILPGGAADFLRGWVGQGEPRKQERINFDAIAASVRPVTPSATASATPIVAERTVYRADIRRKVKTMLFADVKGFSKLAEQDAPQFFVQFLEGVADLLNKSGGPELSNTWGDGLFMVFDSAVVAAGFALRLLERMDQIPFDPRGRDFTPRLRIALHAGPVFEKRDPVRGSMNVFGRHVNRAARIEPITEPNCVYASEQVAALLALAQNAAFACEYVGQKELPKNDGFIGLYQITRGSAGTSSR